MKNDFTLEKAKLIMQLRKLAIFNTNILSIIEKLPREKFVPLSFRNQSYDNIPLPINFGQTISQPYIVAKMTETLNIQKYNVILEIGTGSGYQTAILSYLSRRVYTVERSLPLLIQAKKRLNDLKISNVMFKHNDGFLGWKEVAPFDRILITCQVNKIPNNLFNQLKIGGIIVAPIGKLGKEKLFCIHNGKNDKKYKEIMPVKFVPMLSGVEH